MALLRRIAEDAIEWLMLILIVGLFANFAMAVPLPLSAARAHQQGQSLSEDDRALLVRNAERYKAAFNGTIHRLNPDGVHYRDFTAANLARLPEGVDSVIVLALWIVAAEQYDLFDAIKPSAMSRIEFTHVLLREGHRRKILPEALNDVGYVPQESVQEPVTVRRPVEASAGQQRQAVVPAISIAFRDIATQMLKEPTRGSFDLAADVARQIDVPGSRIELPGDMQALIVGYIVGSDPINQAQTGKLPLGIFYAAEPRAQQRAYCAAANNIAAAKGRSVDQSVAMSVGYLMARADADRGFAGMEAALSLDGVPCPSPAPRWDNSMRDALAGVDNATRAVTAPSGRSAELTQAPTNREFQTTIDSMIRETGVKTWNPQNIGRQSVEALSTVLAVIDGDEPKYTKQMLPQRMRIEQFHAMILRELGRRDAFGESYRIRIESQENVGSLQRLRSSLQAFRRPTFDYPKGLGPERTLSLNGKDMLIYDGVKPKFINNRPDIEVAPEVAKALGLPPRSDGKPHRIISRTDAADFTWGAALASIRALQPSNPQANSEITIDLVPGGTNDQVQASFCRMHPSIYAEGRALGRNDAALAGGILGRVQARSNYQGASVEVEGIMRPCT